MAFNYFPTGYQPYAVAPTQQNANQQNSRIFVQGETGAKGYLVAPNSSVVLWDTESPTIYIKSADASGMPSMRIFDYQERGVQETPNVEYATKSDIEALKNEIEKLRGKESKK